VGTSRFDVLTLVWMVVGYFSLFDLGLGRAFTKLVAEKLGKGLGDKTPALIWTVMSLLGVLGAVVVAALPPWLVGGLLKLPSELQTETLTAFCLLVSSISIVISTAKLHLVELPFCFCLLEAHRRKARRYWQPILKKQCRGIIGQLKTGLESRRRSVNQEGHKQAAGWKIYQMVLDVEI
jgi:hypothetical protein